MKHFMTLVWLCVTGAAALRGLADGKQAMLQMSAKEEPPLGGPIGKGDCFGLVSEMCKPCPPKESNDCKNIEDTCSQLFCNPLCLRLTWECSIEGSGMMEQAGQPEFERALCGEIIGEACSEEFGCCDKEDTALMDWVERYVYGDSFPEPLLPIPVCKHDPTDEDLAKKMCTECKKGVKIRLKALPDNCEFGLGSADEGSRRRLLALMGTHAGLGDGEGIGGGLGSFPFMGEHKSFQERCEKMTVKLAGKLPPLINKWKERACECLGCCDPSDEDDTCFFSFTRVTT